MPRKEGRRVPPSQWITAKAERRPGEAGRGQQRVDGDGAHTVSSFDSGQQGCQLGRRCGSAWNSLQVHLRRESAVLQRASLRGRLRARTVFSTGNGDDVLAGGTQSLMGERNRSAGRRQQRCFKTEAVGKGLPPPDNRREDASGPTEPPVVHLGLEAFPSKTAVFSNGDRMTEDPLTARAGVLCAALSLMPTAVFAKGPPAEAAQRCWQDVAARALAPEAARASSRPGVTHAQLDRAPWSPCSTAARGADGRRARRVGVLECRRPRAASSASASGLAVMRSHSRPSSRSCAISKAGSTTPPRRALDWTRRLPRDGAVGAGTLFVDPRTKGDDAHYVA